MVDSTERLTLAMRELEQFSYAVANDFRVPLRAIEGIVAALRSSEPALGAQVVRGLEEIRGQQAAIGAMIENLLDLTRAAGRPLDLSTIEMAPLVMEAWASIRPPYAAELVLGPLPPARGDRSMLKLVWANLLANALRFAGPNRAPRVAVTGGPGNGHAVYSVRDNGPGFDLGFSGKLFYVYEKIQAEHPGTGVALAIVQRLVTRHRGNVWVEAHAGHGTVFQFSLPLHGPSG